MRNQLLSLFAVLGLFLQVNVVESQCPSSINLYEQNDIDNFATDYPDCVTQGWVENLYITDNNGSITDLSPLYVIDSISNRLEIKNTQINSLNSWSNLESIGSLTIQDNNLLSEINGFDIVDIKQTIVISNNLNLQTLSSFQHVKRLELGLDLRGSPQLSSLPGFSQLEEVELGITILEIGISDLDDFQSLKIVGGNFFLVDNINLTDISKLNELEYLTYLQLDGNLSLNSCCAIVD